MHGLHGLMHVCLVAEVRLFRGESPEGKGSVHCDFTEWVEGGPGYP